MATNKIKVVAVLNCAILAYQLIVHEVALVNRVSIIVLVSCEILFNCIERK